MLNKRKVTVYMTFSNTTPIAVQNKRLITVYICWGEIISGKVVERALNKILKIYILIALCDLNLCRLYFFTHRHWKIHLIFIQVNRPVIPSSSPVPVLWEEHKKVIRFYKTNYFGSDNLIFLSDCGRGREGWVLFVISKEGPLKITRFHRIRVESFRLISFFLKLFFYEKNNFPRGLCRFWKYCVEGSFRIGSSVKVNIIRGG